MSSAFGAALQTAEAFVTLDITQTHVQDGTACGPGEGLERGQQSSDTRAAIAEASQGKVMHALKSLM